MIEMISKRDMQVIPPSEGRKLGIDEPMLVILSTY